MRGINLMVATLAGLASSVIAIAANGASPALQYPQLLPGKYEETIQFVSHSSNAPPELAARFDDKKPFTRKFCYKRDLADPLAPSLLQFRAGRDCAPVSAVIEGTMASGKFSCDGSGYSGELAYSGSFTSTTADLQMDVAINIPGQDQPVTINSTHAIRRVAEACTDAES